MYACMHIHTHREGLLPFFTTAFLRTKIGRGNSPVFWAILILPLPKSRTIIFAATALPGLLNLQAAIPPFNHHDL